MTFKYDPFGRRIEKVSPTTTSIFAYDGDNLVETVNSSGGVVARYTQGENIDEPLAMQRVSTTSFYEADGLGSITSLSNTSGALAQTYTYDSFGNQTASSGSLTNFFRYTGREFDTETNLYYYRARYYDPQIGRFASEDPIMFSGGDQDFYRYVWNSAPNLIDPPGLIGVGWTLGAGGVAGTTGKSPIGVGGSTTIGGLYFPDPKGNGGFMSYGGFAFSHSLCRPYQNNQSGGIAGGVGPGVMITNANSINEVSGPFNNSDYYFLGITFSFAYSPSTGVWTLGMSTGEGLGFSQYTTNTITNPVSPSGPGCSCNN